MGTARLKSTPCPKFSTCSLEDQQRCNEVKAVDRPRMNSEALKKLSQSKKPVEELAKKYDAFLASESPLTKQIYESWAQACIRLACSVPLDPQ